MWRNVIFLQCLFSVFAGKLSVYTVPGLLCLNKSHTVCTEKRKRQITRHVSGLLLFKYWCGCWWENRWNYRLLCSFIINYGLPCLYSWSPLWLDNDTLSCNQRYSIDEQRNISLSMYTSNYLFTCACWWTVTSRLNKYGPEQFQESADDGSSGITTTHRMWCYELQCVHSGVICP